MSGRSFQHALAGAIVVLVACMLWTPCALADPSPSEGPQYGSIGRYGEVWRGAGFDATAYHGGLYDKPLTPGEFLDPVGFAVDTQDQTSDHTGLYVLDRTSRLPGNASGGVTTWRLQKLSDRGQTLGADRFSLPADGNNYEMLGLALDPSGDAVYALVVAFAPDGGFEAGEEIVGWSTTPTASGQLKPVAGLHGDDLATGIDGYPRPGLLSSQVQLSPEGNPQIMSPQGLALDVSGGAKHLAVEGIDPTGQGGTGITQVCASPACGTAHRGAITAQWSSAVLQGLKNNDSDATFGPAGISSAADGSLTVLLNGLAGPAPSNIDVVDVPADLTSESLILSSRFNTVENSDDTSTANDDAAVFTEDAPVEGSDPDGVTPATILAAPQLVDLSNGLYAGEFQPDPTGATDPQNPAGEPGLWTNHNPGLRLLMPESDKTLSNQLPPLTSLFDTLGNPTVNQTASTTVTSACSLSDHGTAAAGNSASPYVSLQAGANGSLWILTRGTDSAGGGANPRGGRELIELAPGAGDPCPGPSGTFSMAPGGGTAQPASASKPLTVTAGTTVDFDASTINYLGGATAAYGWDFGDGDSTTTLGSIDPPFQWPDSTASETYTKPGQYTVTLKLHGDFGVYIETGAVDVETNTPPVAAFTYSPPAPNTSTAVSFDASASVPSPGATTADYLWEWGDGMIDDTSSPADLHTYSTPGTYTVRLRIHDSKNGLSAATSETVAVAAAPPPLPPPITPATSKPPSTTRPARGVMAPAVGWRFSPQTSRQGMVSVAISCPKAQTSCSGSVTLRTTKPVAAPSVGKKKGKPRKRVLILGKASFSVSGGKHTTIRIALTVTGLGLLRRAHAIRVVATISALNPQGKKRVRSARTTLRYPPVKSSPRRRR